MPQDMFVQALSTSSLSTTLFSTSEKWSLAGLCLSVFALPLCASALIIHSQHPIASFTAPITQQALLPQPTAVGSNTSDELAMANYFLEKAKNADSADAANLLSQAQALLDNTTQTGTNVTELKNQVSSSVQRVAAPAPATTASLAATTSSNATGTTTLMKAGTTISTVSVPTLKEGTQIYITIPDNRDNAIVYVKDKKAGVGFTLVSLTPLLHDVTVSWYEIANP